ncbi:MAG: hypothetical protein WC899_07335 [bacterium]|jgi:hypothetical protein
MTEREIVYRREELYAEVWAEPVDKIAKRYGVSGVALAKTCRKLGVPLPPRGHWARIQAGQKIPVPPLPPFAGKNEIRTSLQIPRTDPLDKDTERILTEDLGQSAALPSIQVPKTLDSPHPLVRKTLSAYRDGKVGEYGLLARTLDAVDLRVGPASLDRVLRIYDALFKAVEYLGGKSGIGELVGEYRRSKRPTFVILLGEKVEIAITEKTRRRDHVLTPEELKDKAKGRYFYAPRYDYHPTGELTFKIISIGGGSCKTEWTESSRRPLESNLGDVLEGIRRFAAHRIAEREDEARKSAEKEIILARLAELRGRREEEKHRFEHLEFEVGRWSEARSIRAFAEAAQQTRLRDENWVRWALEQADRVDPLVEGRSSPLEKSDEENKLEMKLQGLRFY